jgi:hypothetical protein
MYHLLILILESYDYKKTMWDAQEHLKRTTILNAVIKSVTNGYFDDVEKTKFLNFINQLDDLGGRLLDNSGGYIDNCLDEETADGIFMRINNLQQEFNEGLR